MSSIAPLLIEAERYFAEKDIDRAAELYKRAAQLDGGGSPLPNVGFARIALALGRIDEAIALLDFVLTRHANSVEALTVRGVAEDARGDAKAAISFYERAIAADPRYGLAHFNLGRSFAQLEKWTNARDAFAIAAGLLPNASDVHCAWGVACFRANDVAKALKVLGEAVQREPGHLDLLVTLIDVLVEAGQVQLAEELIANGTVRFPNAAVLHSKRAALALRRKDVEAARAEARRVCELAPKDEEAWLFSAMLDVMQLELDSAEASLRKVVKLNPRNWRAHHQLGVIYDALRAKAAAQKAYRNAIDCNPHAWEPVNNLATLLLEEGSPKSLRDAQALYELAIQIGERGQVFRAHYNLALVLMKLGDRVGAQRHAREATRLAPANDDLASASHRLARMCA